MRQSSGEPLLAHITTVPESLQFLTGQCRHARVHGYRVLAVSSPGEGLDTFTRQEQISGRAVPMTRAITPAADIVALFRLMTLWRAERPSIVHAHTPKGGLLGMISAFLCRVPVRIYHLHGLPFETATGLRRALLVACERVSCWLATDVLAVSRSLAEVAVGERLVAEGRVRVLGDGSINGIDSSGRFAPRHHDRAATRQALGLTQATDIVGFVGRLVADKGLADLMTAWADIRQARPHSVLLLVGRFEADGALDATVRQTIAQDPRVRVTGWVADVERYYAVMDVLALPSYREGFGLAAAEAMSMEVPVVGSRVTGLVDVITDGRTGTLVEPGDPEALSAAIEAYLSDSPRAELHARQGRESVVERFSPERTWAETLATYSGALDAAR